MMKHLQKTIALVWILSTCIVPAFSQVSSGNTPQVLIQNFLYALYQTDQDPLAIAKQYIALQGAPNEFSPDIRYQGVAEHLAMLRQGQVVGRSTNYSNNIILYNSKVNKIVPYKEANPPRLNASLTKEQEANMYVLTENGKPLRYFLIHDNKIISFDYMVKGTDGPVYFLGY